MISILEYIIFICKKYNNFSEYFIGEIDNSITIFQFFNCVILNLILIFLFIRFIIKTRGFYIKGVLTYIFTRLILVLSFVFPKLFSQFILQLFSQKHNF